MTYCELRKHVRPFGYRRYDHELTTTGNLWDWRLMYALIGSHGCTYEPTYGRLDDAISFAEFLNTDCSVVPVKRYFPVDGHGGIDHGFEEKLRREQYVVNTYLRANCYGDT